MIANNFINNSDNATLKNDGMGTVSLYIGDSGLLTPTSYKIYESFITIGTRNSGIRGQLYSSLSSDRWATLGMTTPVTVTYYNGSTPVGTFTYDLPVVVERSSPTQIRLYAKFYNYSADVNFRVTSGYHTVYADIVTFLSPFN